MSRWENFFRDIQQDLKLFVFILGVFCLFRIGFILMLHSYLSDAATFKDVLLSLYYGLRISLKSTVGVTMMVFVLATGVNLLTGKNYGGKIRLALGSAYIALLTLFFYVRIPYYEQFHMAFNQLLFNTLRDDVGALFYTLVQQYNLFFRLLWVAVTSFVLFKLLQRWLTTATWPLPRFSKRRQTLLFRVSLCAFLILFGTFAWFGGSLTYAYDITWENSAATKDDLLNEAILDDVQALYRAYVLHERLVASNGLTVDTDRLTEYGNYIAGEKINSGQVDDFFRKEALGSNMDKPRHVFLIIGESYANWPLLPKYKDLNIANGLKNIIAQEDAVYVPALLPNGMATIAGVNGIVSGLPEVNLYINYQQESYKEPYATALAPQMKRLGYKTRFWYAGPSSWERVKDFVLAQGFDEFYDRSDLASQAGNVWGSDDKYLFNRISETFTDEEPTLDVILTVSNHAPFTVDLAQEGFDADNILGGLPEKQRSDQELIKKLGHFWYADKVMSGFVGEMRQRYPNSLFLITGDHADRLNIEPNPDLYTRYGIPLVIYGPGIHKNSLPPRVSGSQINITPTLIELIAPKGFTYYSTAPSLTRGNDFGFNYAFWITSGFIGKNDTPAVEALPGVEPGEAPPDEVQRMQDVEATRAVSWWRVQHGKTAIVNE